MKLWIDDIRLAPAGYIWCKSVNEAVEAILNTVEFGETIELLDMDHDAGSGVQAAFSGMAQ